MTPMPEIDIEDALKQTLAYVKADERYLQDFFGDRPPFIQNDIIRFFRNEPIDINPAYDKDQRTMPMITILAGDGGTTDNYNGDYLGSELDDDNFTTLFLVGERQRGSVDIIIESTNNRQVSYLAGFTKAALILHRANLNDVGLNEMTMDWQKLDIDTEISTIPVFRYTITVSFMYNIVVAQRYGPTPENISGINILEVTPTLDDDEENEGLLDNDRFEDIE